MKRHLLIATAGLALGVGCQDPVSPPFSPERSATNRWSVQTYADDSARLAVIRQRTIYGHHFITDSAVLNELGMHELAILADHLREHGGRLNVSQGAADETLYQQRLTTIAEHLTAAGIEEVAMADELPGGEGLPSQHVLVILGSPAVTPNYPSSDTLQRPEFQQ